jgi:hypothetical protein
MSRNEFLTSSSFRWALFSSSYARINLCYTAGRRIQVWDWHSTCGYRIENDHLRIYRMWYCHSQQTVTRNLKRGFKANCGIWNVISFKLKSLNYIVFFVDSHFAGSLLVLLWRRPPQVTRNGQVTLATAWRVFYFPSQGYFWYIAGVQWSLMRLCWWDIDE